MSPTIEKLGGSLVLGEGPHWDATTQSLYFVDIFGGSINRYDPETKKHYKADIEPTVSFIIPVEGTKDKFVAGLKCTVGLITWDGISEKVSSIETLAEIENPSGTLQFNDGKADPSGRLWLGTLSMNRATWKWIAGTSALYSFDGKSLKKHLGDITISNGLTWNKETKKFYYIDTPQRKVFQFDYDYKSGKISNQQVVFNMEKHDIPGNPDGQTIDADGNLWVAIFDGGRVIKIDPRRPDTLLQTVNVPAKQTTSVAFGGRNYDELYVTTGNIALDQNHKPEGDGNGYTYVVKGLGVKGLPATNVKL